MPPEYPPNRPNDRASTGRTSSGGRPENSRVAVRPVPAGGTAAASVPAGPAPLIDTQAYVIMGVLVILSTAAFVLAMLDRQPETAPIPTGRLLARDGPTPPDDPGRPYSTETPSSGPTLRDKLGPEYNSLMTRSSPSHPDRYAALKELRRFIQRLENQVRNPGRISNSDRLALEDFLSDARKFARNKTNGYAYSRVELGLPADLRSIGWKDFDDLRIPRDARGYYILFDGESIAGINLGDGGFRLDKAHASLVVRHDVPEPTVEPSNEPAPEAKTPEKPNKPKKNPYKPGDPNAKSPESKSPDSKSPDSKSPDSKSASGKSPSGKSDPPKSKPRPGQRKPGLDEEQPDEEKELPAAPPKAYRWRPVGKTPFRDFELIYIQEWHVGHWPRSGPWYRVPPTPNPNERLDKLLVLPFISSARQGQLLFDDDLWDSPNPPPKAQHAIAYPDGSHPVNRTEVRILVIGNERRVFVNGEQIEVTPEMARRLGPPRDGRLEFVVSAKGPVDYRLIAEHEWNLESAAAAKAARIPQRLIDELEEKLRLVSRGRREGGGSSVEFPRFAMQQLEVAISELSDQVLAQAHREELLRAAVLVNGIMMIVYPPGSLDAN